jgi:hypothetical protein
MHVATQLFPSSFSARAHEVAVGVDDVFPDWSAWDRFGVVVNEPFGGLGASLLLQLAIAQFYEVRPQRRSTIPAYP